MEDFRSRRETWYFKSGNGETEMYFRQRRFVLIVAQDIYSVSKVTMVRRRCIFDKDDLFSSSRKIFTAFQK